MIVEIEKPIDATKPTLDYNENKVMLGVAELVAYANLDSTEQKYIYDTFAKMEKTPYAVREKSFHASVNPSEEDTCSEQQVLDFITLLMEALGFKDQPYLVYRHFDIEREHYHIVSIRVDENGRKINNYYEQKKTLAFMNKVCSSYGFSTVAKGYSSSLRKEDGNLGKRKVSRFDPKKNIKQQFQDIFAKALSYDFVTANEFFIVLEHYGIEAELFNTDSAPRIRMRGLDRKGKRVSDFRTEESLGLPLYEMMYDQIEVNKGFHNRRIREKERVGSIVKAAFPYAKSESHFKNILANKGISAHFSRTVDNELFGIAFVDHVTKSCFKASEISDCISVKMVNEAVGSGRWRIDNGERPADKIRSARKSLRQDTIALRDLHVSTVARILKPLGQPSGASWNGKPGKSEDQIKEERKIGSSGRFGANMEETPYKERAFQEKYGL